MKKFISLMVAASLAVLGFSASVSEYRVKINSKISVGTSEAFECVSVIAHLAGFEEFNVSGTDYSACEAYFEPYLSQKEVKNAVNQFQKQRNNFSFGYDAVASLGTYLTPDCQSFRTDLQTVKHNLDSRCNNPEKLLKAASAFFKATDFDSYYRSQLPVYRKNVQYYFEHKYSLIACVQFVEKYYRTTLNPIFISISELVGGGNYGTNFNDGKQVYFEPKYSSQYFEEWVIVHELSHPFSNPFTLKVYENPAIRMLLEKDISGEKLKIMKANAYGNPSTYLIELLNRANTINILEEFMSPDYVKNDIYNDKISRFDEIEETAEIFRLYKNGSWNSIDEFAQTFTEKYLELLNSLDASRKNAERKASPESIESFTLMDKTYRASYCGKKSLPFFGITDIECNFWVLEDVYEDVINCPVNYLFFMTEEFYPCPLEEKKVYRVEMPFENGTCLTVYFRNDGKLYDGLHYADCFLIE